MRYLIREGRWRWLIVYLFSSSSVVAKIKIFVRQLNILGPIREAVVAAVQNLSYLKLCFQAAKSGSCSVEHQWESTADLRVK